MKAENIKKLCDLYSVNGPEEISENIEELDWFIKKHGGDSPDEVERDLMTLIINVS